MKKRIPLTLAATAILVGSTFIAASPAYAVAVSCASTGSGTLCAHAYYGNTGYQASYAKNPGGWGAHVDFNLICANGRWFGDEGAFIIAPGTTRTYVFQVGNQGSCKVVLYDRDFGGQWSTGYVSNL